MKNDRMKNDKMKNDKMKMKCSEAIVFFLKTDQQAADALNAKGPGKCVALSCDVADQRAVESVAAKVKAACPNGLHVLVNNSGATWGEAIEVLLLLLLPSPSPLPSPLP
jgi:NAD(P)-dependent dehydrogenase (short-subunit alcohol dehydrogenase family)